MLKTIRLLLKLAVPSLNRIGKALEEQNKLLAEIRLLLRQSTPHLGPEEDEEPEELSSYSEVDEEEDAMGEIKDLIKRFGPQIFNE